MNWNNNDYDKNPPLISRIKDHKKEKQRRELKIFLDYFVRITLKQKKIQK